MITVNKIKVLSWIIGIIIFVSNFEIVIADDEDDKTAVGELVRMTIEIIIGFGIETCSQNPSCNYFLVWVVFFIIFIASILMVFCRYRPEISGRDLQSGLNMYIGMRLARD